MLYKKFFFWKVVQYVAIFWFRGVSLKLDASISFNMEILYKYKIHGVLCPTLAVASGGQPTPHVSFFLHHFSSKKPTNQPTPGLNASDLTSSNLSPALGLHLSASLVCTVLCSNGAMHIHFALHQATADLAFSVAPIKAPNSELVVPLGNVKVTRCRKKRQKLGPRWLGWENNLVRWRPEGWGEGQ